MLPPGASQSDVYQAAVRPIVEDVLAGYNGTVMAYGQTGAGKTYTLSSIQPDAIGMIPRAAAEIFAAASGDAVHEYTILLSYIQIYQELIQVGWAARALGWAAQVPRQAGSGAGGPSAQGLGRRQQRCSPGIASPCTQLRSRLHKPDCKLTLCVVLPC